MAFHRLEHYRDQWPQPLAADPVEGFPENNQSLSGGIIIDAPARARSHLASATFSLQQPRCVLPLKLRHRHKLVNNEAPLGATSPGISFNKGCHQLVTRCHADPAHARPR